MFLVKQVISCWLIDYDDDDDDDTVEKRDEGDDELKKMMMRAMVKKSSGGGLEMRRVIYPQVVEDDQVLIKIVAAGVNRCDMLSKLSNPGHECSGIITALGKNVDPHWRLGDKVCALLDGGGYAEQVVVAADRLLPVPPTITLADAASLPYAACSVCLALSSIDDHSLIPRKKTILINDADTAIGVIAVQVAKYKGFKVIATSGSTRGMKLCREELGADVSINTKIKLAQDPLCDETKLLGVDVIMDCGSSNLDKPLRFPKEYGIRLIIDLDIEREHKCRPSLCEFYLYNLRLQVINLRRQNKDEKASIVAQVRKNIWPAIEEGKVRPIISQRLPLMAATAAHKVLGGVKSYGSVLLYP